MPTKGLVTVRSAKRAPSKTGRSKTGKHFGIKPLRGKGGGKLVMHHKAPADTFGRRGFSFVARFMDDSGKLVLDDISNSLGLSKGQLAETVGIRPETLHRTQRVLAPKTQSRVREMLEIVGRIADWAGGEQQAIAWYRAEPIPAFGGRTAEALVKEGKATAVREYLDHIATGGFA